MGLLLKGLVYSLFFKQSYWTWLPLEIQEYIISLAWHQHMRESSHPLFNLLMRDLLEHHYLTSYMNEGLCREHRGRIVYEHNSRNCDVRCPNHICKSPYSSYICTIRHIKYVTRTSHIINNRYGCTGNPNCHSTHTNIYFKQHIEDGTFHKWFLGYSFSDACERMEHVHRYMHGARCPCGNRYDFTYDYMHDHELLRCRNRNCRNYRPPQPDDTSDEYSDEEQYYLEQYGF